MNRPDLSPFRFPGIGSLPRWSCWRCAGPCATACRAETSKSSWPSGGIEVDHVTIYRWVQRFTLCVPKMRSWPSDRGFRGRTCLLVCGILYRLIAALALLAVRSGRAEALEIIVLRLWVPETVSWLVRLQFGTR